MSFGQKTANGFAWNLVETVANYGSLFVIGIILARLLSPTEFGVIGILTIFISVFDSIVDCGFSNALIRKQKVEEIDYDTIFIFNIVISLLLYLLFFIGSPLISNFFNDETLSGYARVLGLVVIINAF
ncbi:MAG: oligosaccharide flippase family protein, partial [Aeriscardovia sp.]|nr:oligosaccharide flippase family protein [Aeriscardovia sp.]